MSDSACVYIGGDHNVTNTLLKIADYNNDGTTSSHKVVHFYSENKDDDYYFQAATNGGYHYYRGYLGIGTTPSSSYRVYANGNAYITGRAMIGGYTSTNVSLFVGGGQYYNSSSKYVFDGTTQRVLDDSTYAYYYLYRRYAYVYQSRYTTAGSISIYSSYGVYASRFIVSSDERIKENIVSVPDDLSLSIIRKLDPKYYTYKDIVNKGGLKQIGFMAQDVLKHIPDAVRFTTNFIPNEMKLLSSPIWTTFHDLSGNLKYKLTVSDLKDPSGNTRYHFMVSDDADGINEIKKEIPSLENEPNSFVFDKKWNNVFVYGKEVDDFHVLDKAKIWAVAYSALQEVDRIQQREQTKLKEAESKIKNLENQLAGVLSRLSNLEKN